MPQVISAMRPMLDKALCSHYERLRRASWSTEKWLRQNEHVCGLVLDRGDLSMPLGQGWGGGLPPGHENEPNGSGL